MYFALCLQEWSLPGCYYEIIEEMERLAFVGSSAIVLSTTIFLTIKNKFQKNEKDLDLEKSDIVSRVNV